MIKLKARIAHTRSEKKKRFFLQHNNARPHASPKTTECVTKFGWTMLPHLPYTLDLAPSNFYQFEPLKGLPGQHFVDNNAVIDAVKKWTATAGREFYHTGPHSSLEKMHWKWWWLCRQIKFLNIMCAWFGDVVFFYLFLQLFELENRRHYFINHSHSFIGNP